MPSALANRARGLVTALTVAAVLAAAGSTLLAQAAEEKVDAAAIYKQRCLLCHGPEGKAPLPEMSFVDRAWKHGTSLKEVMETIREGVKGTAMLPMKRQLSEAQIEALAKYVRSLDKKLKPEA
jgi:mono/diheme cytochrome c family protein